MDTLIQSQSAGAGSGAFLAVAVWAAAIVAAVVATVQRAQGIREVRERLGEMEQRIQALTEPVRLATSPRTTSKFGAALYQEQPSPFESLVSWPGAALTLIAAVLGIAGGGLLITRAGGNSEGAAHYQAQLGGLKASQDSLLVLVQGLRDSVRAASDKASSTAAPTRTATPVSGKSARLASAANQAAARKLETLPKAPALDPGAIGASPKAPDTVIPKAPVAP